MKPELSMAPIGKERVSEGRYKSILGKQSIVSLNITRTHTHQNIDEQILLLEVFYLKPGTELRYREEN